MKCLLNSWSLGLMVVVVTVGFLKPVLAQNQWEWKNQSIQLVKPDGSEAETISKEAPSFAGRKYWILQSEKPFNPMDFATLQSKGVDILYRHNQQVIEVSIPRYLSLGTINSFGISGFIPITSAFKQDKDLKNKMLQVDENETVRIQVLANKGIKSSLIQNNWNPRWGIIESLWNGDQAKWVIRCTKQEYDSLSAAGWTRWLEQAESELIPFNQVASANGRVQTLASAGFGWANGLDGSEVRVAVGDGGLVETHADLERNQENWVSTKLSSFGDHQDHVSGTLGGNGFLQSDKAGMAPAARIINLQTSSVISTGAILNQTEGVSLTNNSYGQALQCNRAGLYNITSSFMDDQTYWNSSLLHVVASGNQGGTQCNGYPVGYQTIAEGYPVSKNALTVGSILGLDEFAWFSSMGPVADGRVKPEIVADGNDLMSTIPHDQYGAKGGTSMATPVVTGTLALLTQRFKQLNNNTIPDAALLKGIVCNSAEDLGRANVDFSTGFGRINGRRARQIIEDQSYFSDILVSSQLNQSTLIAPLNATGIKVMLVWSDPAGLPGSEKALVNNLDLLIRNASGQLFLPWVLNSSPSRVSQLAERGVDSLNTIEQVTLPVFGGENLQIIVQSGVLTTENQKYWVVYQWELPAVFLTSPIQNEKLVSNQSQTFRWDISSVSINSLTLQSSFDSLTNWIDVQAFTNSQKLAGNVILPNFNSQNIWYRLKIECELGVIYSNTVGCLIGKTGSPTFQTCESSLRISWPTVENATRYQILQLQAEKGIWENKGFTQSTNYTIGNLENGVRYVFSICPWFGNQPGIQSSSKVVTPTLGVPCLWDDLALVGIEYPTFSRLGTSQELVGPKPIRIIIKNIGNSIQNKTGLVLKALLPSGQIVQSSHSFTLAAGNSITLQMPQTLSFSTPGNYSISVWGQSLSDQNPQNDTLVSTIRVEPNLPIQLPWKFDGEQLANESQTESGFACLNQSNLDFESTNFSRIRTSIRNLSPDFETRALCLDKKKLDGKTGNSSLIFTLNLAGNSIENELLLGFDLMPFGALSSENSLWIRENDQSQWELVQSLATENSIGEVQHYQSINLMPFIHNQTFSRSFQLKFSYSGQKPGDILNGGGYAIDNLILYIPSRDVVVHQLISPKSSCVGDQGQKVKVRIFNERNEVVNQVRIGYSINAGEPVEQMIPEIGPLDSLDVEFMENLPTDALGKIQLKIWSIAEDDHFALNDTLENNKIFISPTISAFPYQEGFEKNDGFWKAYGTKSSWEWGSPTNKSNFLDSAANGTKLWATSLNGNYNSNEQSYLQSPCFNLDTVSGNIQVSFNSKFKTETDYDFAWIEYSSDGLIWTKIGEKGKGTNWYNHDSQLWNGTQSRWQAVSYKIPFEAVSSTNNLQFRIGFSSDVSNQDAGFAIDDFHVELSKEIGSGVVQSVKIRQPFGDDKWVALEDQSGRYAEVNSKGQALDFEFTQYRNEGPIQKFGYIPFLDRGFVFSSGSDNQTESSIRLFFTDDELKKLEGADHVVRSFQQLGVFQYRGFNQDFTPENNLYFPENFRFIPASEIQKTPTSGGYFIEFKAVPNGEFYITSTSFGSGDSPLPVSLIEFSAKRKGGKNEIEVLWKTASERNCDRFELEYSSDGISFSSLGIIKSKGSETNGYDYSVRHSPPNQNRLLRYRLKQFDINQQRPVEYQTMLRWETENSQNLTWLNPFGNKLQWFGDIDSHSNVEILDVLGREIWKGNLPVEGDYISSSGWLSGTYLVKVIDEDGTMSTQKIIKTE